MMRYFLPFAFGLLGCGSVSTIETPFIEVDAGQDAPLVCAYDRTAVGLPCETDERCQVVTACEYGRCDVTGVCVVNDGAPDGTACENKGTCKDWVCCH